MNEEKIFASEIVKETVIQKLLKNLRSSKLACYRYGQLPAFQNHKKSKGLGKVLNCIGNHPDIRPAEVRSILNMHSQYAEGFQLLRHSGLIKSIRGHYSITQLGKDFLSILPD